MDVKINNRLAFIQNRCQICLYEKYKSLKNLQDFSWTNVCKIIYFTNDPQICSICFGESILPRIDRCGHLFCLSCILNFFEITNSERISCPMCKDVKIDVNSFKRVTFCKYNIPKVGESVAFKLMVKGNDNVCPRFADNLCNYSEHVIPRKCSGIGKYLGVVVEKDFNTFESIRNDIILLKKRKSTFCPKNFGHTMLHLTSEMEHFKNEIKIIDREKLEDPTANYDEKFNLLEYKKMKNRFKLFYQSGFFHSVYLDEEIQQEIIKGALDADEVIPVCVKGEITAIRTEVVDNEFLQESRMNHLFQGAKITYLSIDLNNFSCGSIEKCQLKVLRSHQEELFKAEKEEEELRRRVAKRAAETKYSKAPCRIVTSGTLFGKDNGGQDIDSMKRKFENIVEGFNTCTLGIECLVPDDDYPHAENCIYYREDFLVSKENVTEDKYFGLLRFKLNVFHGDEEASRVEESSNKNDVKRVVNYPPEIIDFNEFETPVKSNMLPYIVPKKPSSQFQQKQIRKMKKSISKISC